MSRRNRRKGTKSRRVRIVTVAEMQVIRDRLARSMQCGPAFQAVTIESMEEYKGAYYQTDHGLRRVFSKEQEEALFSKENLSLLKQKLKVQDPMKRPEWAEKMLQAGARGGGFDAAGQPEENAVRDQ